MRSRTILIAFLLAALLTGCGAVTSQTPTRPRQLAGTGGAPASSPTAAATASPLPVTPVAQPSQPPSRGRVWAWEIGDYILHPRLSPDGLYFTNWPSRVWLQVDETHFVFWDFPMFVNGLSVGDRVYVSADEGPALALDPKRDVLYAWEGDAQFGHVFAWEDTAYFAGTRQETGVIGAVSGDTLTYLVLGEDALRVRDVVRVLNRLYFSVEFKEEPKGGIGVLSLDDFSYVLWRFPEGYGTLVPNGITVDTRPDRPLTVYAAIAEGHPIGLVRFEPESAAFSYLVLERESRALHVKRFGNFILVMGEAGLTVVDAEHAAWGETITLLRQEGKAEAVPFGRYTRTYDVPRHEKTIEPTLPKIRKVETPEGYAVYEGVLGTHDFGGGYVGAGGTLLLLSELRPEVHLAYEDGTVRAWVTPREYFPDPVYLYVNQKLVRWGETVEWNVTFLEGTYELTAVYFDGEDVYTNKLTVSSDVRPKVVWVKSKEVPGGTVTYGKASVPGAPVEVDGRTVWTDAKGYFSFYTGTEPTQPEKTGGFPWTWVLLPVAVAAVAAGLFLYARKDKRGLLLAALGGALAVLFAVFTFRPAAQQPAKPLTLSLTAVMPPGLYAVNVNVLVDGEPVGATDAKGHIDIPVDYGIHEVVLESDGATTTLRVAMAEDRNLVVPYFPGLDATLTNGPGYNGFAAAFGNVVLNTLHGNTFPQGPIAGGFETGASCEAAKLKAAMVGVVEGESCRLCAMQSRSLYPAALFGRYFTLVWQAIERFPCVVAWPPLPETQAVVSTAGVNTLFGGYQLQPPLGWGNLHPCLAPLDGLDPADPSAWCSLVECAKPDFSCGCIVTCAVGPLKVWEAFIEELQTQ